MSDESDPDLWYCMTELQSQGVFWFNVLILSKAYAQPEREKVSYASEKADES